MPTDHIITVGIFAFAGFVSGLRDATDARPFLCVARYLTQGPGCGLGFLAQGSQSQCGWFPCG